MKKNEHRETIHIRVSPELKAAIVELTAKDGFVSLNEWVRIQLLAIIKKSQK